MQGKGPTQCSTALASNLLILVFGATPGGAQELLPNWCMGDAVLGFTLDFLHVKQVLSLVSSLCSLKLLPATCAYPPGTTGSHTQPLSSPTEPGGLLRIFPSMQ